MFKIIMNALFAAFLLWTTVYIVLPLFLNCYETQENDLQQYIDLKSNKDLISIPDDETKSLNIFPDDKQRHCPHWAVVSASLNPTSAVRAIASDNKWCLVIVADINSLSTDAYLTALGYSGRRIVYLNAPEQLSFFSAISTAIPWRHIGRKNVGYLFAIQNGAELIWDFDYNNQGVLDITSINFQNTMNVLHACRGQSKMFNPYPYFGVNETYIWPRGFPLEYARDTSTTPTLCSVNISLKSVGVIQSVANTEPDLDATFRFTREYPMKFKATQTFPFIMVPRESYCPFNERATLWTKRAFLYMALPISVHSRVSDIWRSYIAQCFFHRDGINLLFAPPFVVQTSSDGNIVEHFQAETEIYQKSNMIIDFLKAFRFQHNTTIEYLYEELYRRRLLEFEDVYFIRIWTKSYTELSGTN